VYCIRSGRADGCSAPTAWRPGAKRRCRGRVKIAKPLILLVLVTSFATAHAEPPPAVLAEVEYLLQSIDTPGCTFFRNGNWYSGARARSHLRAKYDYLASRDLITTTEEFIAKGATKSSLSGEPYKVRCGKEEPVETGQWLRAALARYRASVSTPVTK
jgi:hypothetical protein